MHRCAQRPWLRAAAMIAVTWLSCTVLRGQTEVHWTEAMRNPAVPVDSVEALFDAAWTDGETERGKGLKPFQRWLAFAKPRRAPDGCAP